MATDAPVSKWQFWAGWLLSAAPALMLLASGGSKLLKPAAVVEGFTHLGYQPDLALPLGVVEIVSTVLYLIPQTAVLGAVLLTGYMGGAIATHVRLGEPFFVQVLLGVALWLGLYLRDRRIRALLPLRAA